MIRTMLVRLAYILLILFQSRGLTGQIVQGNQNNSLIKKIESFHGLVALWTFREEPGNERKAIGLGTFPLKESNGIIDRINEGPLSGYSLVLDGTNYLSR